MALLRLRSNSMQARKRLQRHQQLAPRQRGRVLTCRDAVFVLRPGDAVSAAWCAAGAAIVWAVEELARQPRRPDRAPLCAFVHVRVAKQCAGKPTSMS